VKRAWFVLTALTLSLWLGACEPEGPDTSILITVDSDLMVPSEIDRVTVDANGMQDGVEEPSADLREKPLPRTILLTHAGGPYGPFEIVVSAYRENTLVTQKTMRTSFLPGIHSRLTIVLTRGCVNVFCEEGLTCNAGACMPVSQTLPVAGAGDGGAAAGGSDASLVPASDAGAVGADAALDAGVKLDAAVKLDAGIKQDAALGADASTGQDAGGAQDARADSALRDGGPSADAGAGPGATPVCAISKPIAGATQLSNVTFALQGSCTDPETGPLSNVLWVSSEDGPLATGSSTTGVLRTAGAHNIMLCAADPRDARLIGCSSVRVNATVQPTARILSVRQGSDDSEPFVTGIPLTIQGTGTGTGATLSWRDSLQGALGSGSTVMLASPSVGRHVITLDVTDQYGITATATRSFTVLPR
jgi:hypothetical protein